MFFIPVVNNQYEPRKVDAFLWD